MNAFDFNWMIGRTIDQVIIFDHDWWGFKFKGGGTINVTCPWRIVENNLIVVSNTDHKQKFGLPEPIDAAALASKILSSLAVSRVEVREGCADLLISFPQNTQLQIIPFSSGYESWNIEDPFGNKVIAQGGGQLSSWCGCD